MILINSSNNQYENSNNCEQFTETVERKQLGKSICDIQQKNVVHEESVKNYKKEIPISVEKKIDNDSLYHKTNFDVKILEYSAKKRKTNKDEAHISPDKNNATENVIKNQVSESLWEVKQDKKKHKKSMKNIEDKETFKEKNNEIIYEGSPFGTLFSNLRKSKEKLKEFKNNVHKESVFIEAKTAVGMPNDKHNFIDESHFDVQQAKKKYEEINVIFPEETNSAKLSTKEFYYKSLSDILKVKKKLENSYHSNVTKPFVTDVENVIEISDEEIQPVDLFCNALQAKKKPKKSKKEEEFRNENRSGIFNKGKNFETPLITEQKSKEKKYKYPTEEEFVSTDKNFFIETINDKLIDESTFDTQIKKKLKKSEKNKDIEPFFPKENNCTDIPQSISNESFCSVQKLKKKYKKFNRNKVKGPIITEVQNEVEILNEDNQPVDLFCNGLLIKKKHKLKKNKNKEPTTMEERSMIEKLNNENQLWGEFHYEQQAEKKIKKSNKNKAKEPIFTEVQNAVKIIHEENKPLDMYHNIQLIKKRKRNKDIEPDLLEEINMIEVPNKKNQCSDIIYNAPHVMKKHKKSKKNKDSIPNFTEIKKNIEIPSDNIQFIDNEKTVKKKIKKSKMNKDKESTNGEESDIVEIPIGGTQSGDMPCDVQYTEKRLKKYEKNKDKNHSFTEIKSGIEMENDKDQLVYLFHKEQLVEKKDKNGKSLKKEIDMIETPNKENQSGDTFFKIQHRDKKCKKSKKNKDEGSSYAERKNSLEMPDDKIESVDLRHDVNEVKIKHKKSKRIDDKQFIYVKERNIGEITIAENETGDMFCDIPQAMKMHKKSKKNKDKDPSFTEIKNIVEIPSDRTQSADSFCDVKMVKKLRHSKMKDDKESINNEDSDAVEIAIEENTSGEKYCDVEKRTKKYKKDKEHTSLEEINMIEIPNEENQYQSDDMFCNKQHTEKKCNKYKNNNDSLTSFTEIKNSVEISNDGIQSIYALHGIKKKHKKSKRNKDRESANVKESEIVEIPIGEIQSGDMSCDLQLAEKKHKKSKMNDAKKLTYTEVQNVVTVSNKENQFVDSFCNFQLRKKRLKNFKKNKEKESTLLEERIIEIANEENQSGDMFCNVPHSKKKQKKSKKIKDKDSSFTEVNSSVEILNDEMQSVDSFCDVKKVKKKHEKSKRNEDKEYINMEERNTVEIPVEENQSIDIFCDVPMTEKKYKKSLKNKNEEQKNTVKNVIEIENEPNQFVNSFCGSKKKKRKKCKDAEDEEIVVIKESNTVENPIDRIKFVNKYSDIQQLEKKYKKSKKNENEQKITGENSGVKTANEQNKFLFSVCDKLYGKKKLNKSESNMNKETHIESTIEIQDLNSNFNNSFHDLEQLKKIQNKLKQYNNKGPALSIENLIGDTLDEECHLLWDSFSNEQVLKKNHKKSEFNTSEKPTFIEKNNILNKTSMFNKGSSLDSQKVFNIQKSVRNNSKATEHSPSSNMIHQFQKISEVSDIDDKNIVDSQNPNNSENVHSMNENLQKTDSFLLDFCEDPVDFDIPPLHAFENLKFLSDNQRNKLLSQGVNIKTGRYTHEEDKIIQKNYENFARKYGALNFFDMFGIGAMSSYSKINQFLKATHFYTRLGKGLNNRTLRSIYYHARSLFHPFKNKGKLSQAEIENIKYLRLALNKKWTDIGENIEQTAKKCSEALKLYGKSISRGKWTEEEEKQLIIAMKRVMGSPDLSYDKVKKISWEKVATYVPSRNSTQCRIHWSQCLAWKPGIKKGRWKKSCNKKLLEILRKDWYIDDTYKIDWLKIHESFEIFSPSPRHVRLRWNRLKTKIPDFKNKDYKTVLDELCRLYAVSINESLNVPLSPCIINQRLSHSIADLTKIQENR